MRRIRLAIFVASLAAPAALADIDTTTTANGSAVLSGGRGELDSYGLAQRLMDFNNTLAGNVTVTQRTGPVDHAIGLAAANLINAIGYIVTGEHGTKYTYDQLAYKPVLQLIGFDAIDPAGSGDRYLAPTPQTDDTFAPAALRSSAGGQAPPNPVPEPGALAILAVGGVMLLQRPRRT